MKIIMALYAIGVICQGACVDRQLMKLGTFYMSYYYYIKRLPWAAQPTANLMTFLLFLENPYLFEIFCAKQPS